MGAQGVLGGFLARGLADEGWEVTRAGRRAEAASDFRLLDAGDAAAVAEACEEVDLVVNTAHHPELVLERTVLRDGGTLVDLIELSEQDRAALREENAVPAGLVVADTGLGGVGYLEIADLLRRRADADVAEYALMFSASGSSGRAGVLFGHRLLTGARHHRQETVPFAKPFGRRRCLEMESRDGVLRGAIGGVAVRHYLCMQPRPLNGALLALNAARLIGGLPRATFTTGAGKVPSELSEEPVCEWVAVAREGRRLAARTHEGRGYYRMTVAATLAFAEALASSPEDGRRGLRGIDEVLALSDVQPLLERRGITTRIQPLDPDGGSR